MPKPTVFKRADIQHRKDGLEDGSLGLEQTTLPMSNKTNQTQTCLI